MDKVIDRAIVKYIELIRKEFDGLLDVYLFGSYAKGKSTEDSDIDLALIFRSLDDSLRFDIQVQLMLLASRIDSRIEPHPLSHDDFQSGNPFIVEIKNTGIRLSA